MQLETSKHFPELWMRVQILYTYAYLYKALMLSLMLEDILSLRSMRDTCTSDDIFRKCNFVLTDANLSYKLIGVATDGSRTTIGNKKDFQVRI